MKWLEIITIESTRSQDVTKILELCNAVKLPPSLELTVYRMGLRKELRLHIQWSSMSFAEGSKGRLGREISEALSHYGPVNYTIWVEINQSNSGEQPYCLVSQEDKSEGQFGEIGKCADETKSIDESNVSGISDGCNISDS